MDTRFHAAVAAIAFIFAPVATAQAGAPVRANSPAVDTSDGPGPAQAGRTPVPRRLTLSDAVDWALVNNPEIRAAEARVEERRGDLKHAQRVVPRNPEVEIRGAGRSGPDDTTGDIGVRIAQELFTGGKRAIATRSAEASVDSAAAQLEFFRVAVTARVRNAFLQALVAEEAVSTAKRALALAREFESFAERRLAAGGATRLEVNTAAIGAGRAQAELAAARRDAERALLDLRDILFFEATMPLELEGRLGTPALDIPSTERLLTAALRRRQDLAAAAAQAVAAREDLRLSQQQLIPNLTVFGFYEQEGEENIGGLGLSIPLPVLHRFTGEQEAAQARALRAEIERERLQLSVQTEVLRGLAGYRAARESVAALRGETLARAEENVQLVRKAFEAGKVGASAITTAQDNLLNVRSDYLASLRDLVAAGTALERATGGLIVLSESR